MLDIIIPVLNEEKLLKERISYFRTLRRHARLIFVDGGSSDQTKKIARNYGDVIDSERGRCHQLNAGAKAARSSKILFLHADTCLTPEAIEKMEAALEEGICSGCFTLSIDDPRFIFRIFEGLVNFRARAFGVMDGDLGIGVKRDVFEKAGRYDATPIMEDILLSQKLRSFGPQIILSDLIKTSSRKWRETGFLKTFMIYSRAYLYLWTRKPPHHREVGR